MRIDTNTIPYCPKCGAQMALKRPKEDDWWEPFWGCSQFPECKGSRSIREDGSPEPDNDEIDDLSWI